MDILNREFRDYPTTCRYCGRERPRHPGVTCGRSECQETAYRDKERRKPTKKAKAS